MILITYVYKNIYDKTISKKSIKEFLFYGHSLCVLSGSVSVFSLVHSFIEINGNDQVKFIHK